jgi:hypothetical protein
MKRRVFVGLSIIVASVFFTSSCDVLDAINLNFTTDGNAILLKIQPQEKGEIYQVFETIDSDIKQQIEEHGGKIKNLDKVVISDISVEIDSDSLNFDPFQNAIITLSAENLPELKLAWIDEIPLGSQKLFPEHTTDNLKDYLNKENYKITMDGTVRKSFKNKMTIKIIVYYNITL